MASTPVKIATGWVQGSPSEYNDQVDVYKGIPFAASTGAENRWRAPQPPRSWQGVRVANTFGSACPQQPFGPMAIGPSSDEDCLALNLWVPAGSSDKKLPIYVWIYGGRFIAGSGSEAAYDGTGLAAKGIIVVTINYRVGILGFLATPELDAESGHDASGNYGILDQVAALKWVQVNIAAFGGDPTRVTIGGQSAGGASCGLLLMSPVAQGLFQGVAPQSACRYPRDPLLSGLAAAYRTKEKALAQGVATMKEKGAADIAAMRKLPLHLLLEGNNKNDDAWGNPPFYRPCIDGYVFPDTLEACLKNGLQANVPILAGHNADEGGTYADPEFTEDDMKSCAVQKYKDFADRFLKLYPVTGSTTARDAWNEAARDNSRVTGALWAHEHRQTKQSPVYGYFFSHAPPPRKGGPDAPPTRGAATVPAASSSSSRGADDTPKLRIYETAVPRSQYTYSKIGPGARFGAFHGAEIPFVLDNLAAQDGYAYGEGDRAVAAAVSGYWANFIKTGDPNGPGLPEFRPVENGEIMCLGKDSGMMPLARSEERVRFWEDYLRAQPAW